MVRPLIYFALFFLPLLSFSQKMEEQKDPVAEKNRIKKNKISAMKLYRCDWRNGKPSSRTWLNFIETYDKNGNVLAQHWLNEDSATDLRSVYFYDKAGRLEKIDMFGRDTSRWRHEYFPSGQLRKKTLYVKDTVQQSSSTYVYDDKKRLKGICYHTTGYTESFDGCMNYMFDNLGRFAEMIYFENMPDFMVRSVMKYDDAGNQVEMASYNYNQEQMRRSVYQYDKNGNITQETLYVKPSEINTTWKYTYEYFSK